MKKYLSHMILFRSLLFTFIFMMGVMSSRASFHHEILLCGEHIPVENDFVANKLMNIIRRQIPQVNMVALRQRCMRYFPIVQAYLIKNNVPRDFMYLPIVESNFVANAQSGAKARGFWQIMPDVAVELGLRIGDPGDERDDIYKSTDAACRHLKSYYSQIAKKYKVQSWVLTTAAYNFGIGNIFRAIRNQGQDYFSMQLNPETAAYVYKLIAVKELFEYPELYMKNMGYNVFNQKSVKKQAGADVNEKDLAFDNMEVKIYKKKKKDNSIQNEIDKTKVTYIMAHVKGKYKNFEDGDLLAIELDEDLKTDDTFMKRGSVIKGYGWRIDDRIFVDLDFGHTVTLYDPGMEKGIAENDLKKGGVHVLLRNIVNDREW
ncbi:MAG: lytic transglycosylase domain-containing protein [Bacteroidetes bacterium]|nr:lytic transglycosylase domain-containing protein [Bacteroidota bacterium]